MKKRAIHLSAIALGAACACASAVAQEAPAVKFSAFGTVGAVHSNNDQIDFVSNARQPRGAGASRSTSFAPDSVLGAQADFRLGSNLSGTAQIVSQRQDDNSFRPDVELAYLKYQAAPNLDIVAGRSALGAFALSETRLNGRSNLMIRPPVEVYHGMPLTHIDGVGAAWRHDTSMGQLTLEGKAGVSRQHLPGGEARARDLVLASATLKSGPLTYRAAFTTAKLSYEARGLDLLVGGYNQYGAGLMAAGADAALSRQAYNAGSWFSIEKRRANFSNLAVAYDQGPWVAQAEFAVRKAASVIPDTRAWHASAGYRVGKFTPYVGFSRLETTSSANAPALDGVNPAAFALNGLGNAVLAGSVQGQRSATVGVKWNFHENMDLKVQYDDVRLRQNSSGTFVGVAGAGSSKANLTSVAMDFAF